jgi:hypothetical protein
MGYIFCDLTMCTSCFRRQKSESFFRLHSGPEKFRMQSKRVRRSAPARNVGFYARTFATLSLVHEDVHSDQGLEISLSHLILIAQC